MGIALPNVYRHFKNVMDLTPFAYKRQSLEQTHDAFSGSACGAVEDRLRKRKRTAGLSRLCMLNSKTAFPAEICKEHACQEDGQGADHDNHILMKRAAQIRIPFRQ